MKTSHMIFRAKTFPRDSLHINEDGVSTIPAHIFLSMVIGLLPVRAAPPALAPSFGAPQGMIVDRDAVKLRLKNPWIDYQLHTAKSFTGIGNPSKTLVGWTLQATQITPDGTSFTDVFGQTWYDVTPGGSSNQLILSPSMSGILTQNGTPQNQIVSMGRWAITKLRNIASQPLSAVGRNVEFEFDLMCYKPSGVAENGGILQLSKTSLKLCFPIAGVPMQSVTPAGNLATETFISPYNFTQSVSATHDILTPTSAVTTIRPWIWPAFTTFNLAAWELYPTTGLPGPVSVRDSWRRSFQNLTDHVTETSTGSLPLGYHMTSFPDTSQAAAPFFISGGAITLGTVTDQLQKVAADAVQSVQWPFSEDIIFHSAPSPLKGGGGDSVAPAVAITSPASDVTAVTSGSLTMSGTSSDNFGVSHVSIRVINSGGTGAWTTANGTATWSHTVTLTVGSNTLEARSQDATGNISPITSRTVTLAGISTPTGLRLQ